MTTPGKNGSGKKGKSKTTSRKTKILGTQQYVNSTTGEVIDCQVMEVEERDANFQKFWLGHVLAAVDELSNAKMKILFYIFSNVDYSNNILPKTIAEIVEETGISNKTIIETLKILHQYDIIRRKTGIIFLNPNVLFKGGINKRQAVLIKYGELDRNYGEIAHKREVTNVDESIPKKEK